MNANGFLAIIVFGATWILSRIACSWIVRLSYTSAGQSMRSVEKHYDLMKRGIIPKKKEVDWLAEVSLRPLTTKFIYFLFYFITSLPLLGLVLSVVYIFVPALSNIVNTMQSVFFLIPFIGVFAYLFINDPVAYIMKKRDKKKTKKK